MISGNTIKGTVQGSNTLSGKVTSEGNIEGRVTVGGSMLQDAVLYTEQELTEEERAQARKNIGSIGENVEGTVQTPYDVDQQSLVYTWLEPVTALDGAEILNCYGGDLDGMGIPDVDRNIAIGFMSQASGFRTQARGNYSQAGGWWTIAEGQCSHAEGLLSKTLGHFCHAEGTRTQATVMAMKEGLI